MKDEEYIVNNKIYNLTKSTKLYEYIEKEGTGKMIGTLEMFRDVTIRIYKSAKGNLYRTITKMGRIIITDATEKEFKQLLFERNEIDLLRELFPKDIERLEEV